MKSVQIIMLSLCAVGWFHIRCDCLWACCCWSVGFCWALSVWKSRIGSCDGLDNESMMLFHLHDIQCRTEVIQQCGQCVPSDWVFLLNRSPWVLKLAIGWMYGHHVCNWSTLLAFLSVLCEHSVASSGWWILDGYAFVALVEKYAALCPWKDTKEFFVWDRSVMGLDFITWTLFDLSICTCTWGYM